MSDIPKPKFDLPAFEKSVSPYEKTDYAQSLGRSTLGRGCIEMEPSYHRPSFYEIEKGRGTVLVDMDARGDITADNGEEKRIATFGLGGCNAVAISAELPDGTRKGYVQHYSPLNDQLGASTLAEAVDRFATDGVSNVRAVVMTPGEWTQDPSVKWAMVPRDELITNLLTLTVQARLDEADVQVYPYSEMLSADRYGQGTLMVEFRADGAVNMLAESMPIKPLGE
ncbi:MAG TPA: hypothetical protein VF575_03270 [Candidatus Saccharimonadales bacterium]|jgi:hypothetical protein